MDLIEFHGPVARRHPWEVTRCEFFTRELAREGLLERPLSVLDIGAGDAWFADQIARRTPDGASIVCWDPAYAASSAPPSSPKIRLTATLPEGKFDLLLLMDVLEHVPVAGPFLKELSGAHLKPGGTALISVPAWPSLFSAHDRRLKHFRRYVPHELDRVVNACGLTLLRSGGLFHSLIVPRLLQKIVERRRQQAPPDLGEWNAGARWTAAVTGFLRGEAHVSSWLARRRWRVPGLSYWVICRKPA